MNVIQGTSNNILEVDLGKESFRVFQVDENTRRKYLGAKGLGLKLLYDRMAPGVDPLGPDNIIAFMPGVLMGTGAPCSARFHTVTKSPLTGIFVTSSCGGPLGLNLKTAGWDGLLIKGKASKPTYLVVDSDGVAFCDASQLWGDETTVAHDKLDGKRTGIAVIGPAGENLVPMANVRSGHRFTGRGGIGAVMGAKNLKAVVARGGQYKIVPKDETAFRKVCKKAVKYIELNRMTSVAYRKYGTAFNVNATNAANILPVRNFQDGSAAEAEKVSGESMAAKWDTKHHTCSHCAIRCGHRGMADGKPVTVPEYETVGLLGTNLGLFDPQFNSELNDLCGRLGMDTISAGGTIAWVMEAAEKGVIDYHLKFGSEAGVGQALEDMAHRRGFGDEMAMGSRWLSRKYGGADFAIQVKGLEMAAYDPRGSFGQGLAYAVANRGACHLSAYLCAQEIFFKLLNPATAKAKPVWVKYFEDLTACVNALQICQFTMYAYLFEVPLTKYTPNWMLKLLMQHLPKLTTYLVDFSVYRDLWRSVTGIKISLREFLRCGERIHLLERHMNTREGISRKDDMLPQRMLQEGRLSDHKKRTVPLEAMLDEYYGLRGYDHNGIPRAETLTRQGLSVAAESVSHPFQADRL